MDNAFPLPLTYTAASHQGVIKMFWLHFWGAVMTTHRHIYVDATLTAAADWSDVPIHGGHLGTGPLAPAVHYVYRGMTCLHY